MTHLSLTILKPPLAVAQLPAGNGLPWWAAASSFLSFTRTADEDSLVCEEVRIPDGLPAQKGLRALRVGGTLSFELTGVLASLSVPLAGAGVSIFVVSTHDTDYVLVREAQLREAIDALREAGHSVHE